MYNKLACRLSPLGGEVYVREIITNAHLCRCLKVFQMGFSIFLQLSSWLEYNTNLKQSQNHFSIYQKLAIFLQIIDKEDSNQDVQETFQHFKATISLIFHKVLAAVMILCQKIVIILNNSELLNYHIVDDVKYFSDFENFLGAIDDTHLPAHFLDTIMILY